MKVFFETIDIIIQFIYKHIPALILNITVYYLIFAEKFYLLYVSIGQISRNKPQYFIAVLILLTVYLLLKEIHYFIKDTNLSEIIVFTCSAIGFIYIYFFIAGADIYGNPENVINVFAVSILFLPLTHKYLNLGIDYFKKLTNDQQAFISFIALIFSIILALSK